jgi:hypothetical protein
MTPNHEQDYAVVHFAVVVLNMLSIAPIFVFFLGGRCPQSGTGVADVCLLFVLGAAAFVHAASGPDQPRVPAACLTGLLATLVLYLVTGFGMPAIT